jgi:DtxR family transcriptional regulator, Mn-dependent transcriptional regulator
MSESIEMYLVMTALLRSTPAQPVAVSLLAGKLGVSQVSANEMCHKLTERGLLAYLPYKGVTLTDEGEAQAQQILSRRQLWVIFLVENLGIDPEEADTLACQLEHITSERLVAALKAFLERAPSAHRRLEAQPGAADPLGQSLTVCAVGARGQIAVLPLSPTTAAFLRAQGVALGAEVEVLARGADDSVLLGVERHELALAPVIAAQVMLITAPASTTARQETWARCSAFWSCPYNEDCPTTADPVACRSHA